MAFKNILHLPPALRYRNFALYWCGMLISIAGSQMQFSALLWHLRVLSDQPIVVSGIGLARFIPILLIAPFGGLAADSFNRRRIMFITQTTMAVVALALGALTLTGVIQPWHIYLLTGIQAIAISFDLPARQALLPNLLGREALPSAFSLQSIAFNFGAVVGPLLSGVIIRFWDLQSVYIANAASFISVLMALVLMGSIPQEAAPINRGISGSLGAIADGVRFIVHQPVILSSMLLDFIATFFSSANTLLPFVAVDVLHVDEIGYSWLVAAQSIGAVVVGVFLSQKTRIPRQGMILLVAVGIFGFATVGFGLARSFWLVMLMLIFVGAADSVSTILRNTIRQLKTPDHLRGRMVGINQIFFQGGPQLGEIEAGMVAQGFGTPVAIITGGIGCIVAAAVVGVAWPQLRNYQGEEAPPDTNHTITPSTSPMTNP